MEEDSITPERIDELLRFLPLFDVPGREFIEKWAGGEKTRDGAIIRPYPVYPQDVKDFYHLAGQDCWSDYDYEPQGASKMLQDDEFIRTATVENIKTMLTYCVRGERFCDGVWAEMLRSGRIVAILKRLQVLKGQGE